VLARPACIFWRGGNGHCLNGDNCRFSHELADDGDSRVVDDDEIQMQFEEQQQAQNLHDVYPSLTHDFVPAGTASATTPHPISKPSMESTPQEPTIPQIPVLTHTGDEDNEEQPFDSDLDEPHAGPGLGGLVNGANGGSNNGGWGGLGVNDSFKLEVVVSEGEEDDRGEDEESDEDVVVLKPSSTPSNNLHTPNDTIDKGEIVAINQVGQRSIDMPTLLT
jgi:hypothetical protein